MFPGGTWYAPAIEANEPAFDWGYMPFPGSDDAAANQSMFGKYDQGWAIAENSSKKEQALRYLEAFSEPETYQTFVDMVGPIPTQPTASLNTKIGEELAPYLDSFQLGFETIWKAPRGMGQFGDPTVVNLFQPFGTFDDPQAAAEAAQADLDSGLDAIR
jgi:raffinose/stachyose/melibiose transport system substrate-binding protein